MNRRSFVMAAFLGLFSLGLWFFQIRDTEGIDSYASCANAGYPVQDSYPPTCTYGEHTFLGPGSVATPTPPVASSVPFEILVDGDSGGAYPKRQEVITTLTGWQHYWRDVHAGLKSLPPLLPVDFTKDNVVAISEGRRLTTGYNLKVTGIMTDDTGTTVNIAESIPTITCKVAQTTTNRYFIVRTGKLTEPVNFRLTTDYRHC